MKIDRPLYTKHFTADELPLWHCPTCNTGFLKAVETDFTIQESVASKNNYDTPDWEPSWINGFFVGKMACMNSGCGEVVLVLGKMRVQEEKTYIQNQGLWDYKQIVQLFPSIFRPTLHLFKIDDDVPENIRLAIEKAFGHFWLDEASCANKIRNVVELIMDERKVQKTYISGNKRQQYSLHKRIELFKNTDVDAAECLMAVKWIGNSGSHANDHLTKDDLLDGFEILQHVTYNLYEKDTQRIQRLGKKINQHKGPKKRK
jgi:hypothetical protein